MEKEKSLEFESGLKSAFIDSTINSNLAYRPQFVSNNYKEGKKVLSSIEDELLSCNEFQISVAFITLGGIEPLLQTLKVLEKKNIPGKVLTTNYLNFSEPKALKKLNELNNINIKMYDVDEKDHGFHTKGYIFKKEELYRIIIGSSNMTKSALTTNLEWNTKIVSTERGEVAEDIIKEFDRLWNSNNALVYEDFYDEYAEKYEIIKKQKETAKQEEIVSLEKYKLKPNNMQVGFISSLKKLIDKGEDKALLISATGTGKTYASAFAMRELEYKRVLFLVHRGQLAKQTLKSYKKVFKNSTKMGLVGAGHRDFDKDYVFATVQTLNRDEHLHKYKAEDFDCIILDEAHHSSADTYQKIMDYFNPKLWLGMTATPDKRDDNIEGRNIYEIFNHQIAYEIRLQQAMEEDMLCPFHYFGITDISLLDENDIKQKNLSEKDFNALTSEERIKHIVEQATYFGYSGNKVKGLIFCSRIDESEKLSERFNETINPETGEYYRTIALNGSASEEERQEAFERLAMEENEDRDGLTPLDYIFSVDILNEGVDIVEINQVIMLRPTQSPIVFVQQLGRGLRKIEGKEFVVILDFIGNYNNNFMIPIALSGDRSYNKDSMRRYISEGTRIVPGASTVHFDEIAKKRIYSSIDNARTNTVKLIKDAFEELNFRLGRIPNIQDFKIHGSIDVRKIIENFGSYYAFLDKYYRDEYDVVLNEKEKIIIEFISKKITNTKRLGELAILNDLLSGSDRFYQYSNKLIQDGANKNVIKQIEESVIRNLNIEFLNENERKKYNDCVLVEKTVDGYKMNESFKELIDSNSSFSNMVSELIDYGIDNYNDNYSEAYKETNFQLYQKYTYEDVCRLLNWDNNMNAQNIGGYFYESKTKTLPVFVNYEKTDDAIAYEDRFVSPDHIIALSKKPRKVDSKDADHIFKRTHEDADNKIYLFVRKNKDDKESKEFYFLGEINAEGEPNPVKLKTGEKAFEINYKLDQPVREDIYDYIVKEA